MKRKESCKVIKKKFQYENKIVGNILPYKKEQSHYLAIFFKNLFRF